MYLPYIYMHNDSPNVLLSLFLSLHRPCLTWRDIQSLLVYTARPIDLQEVEWTTNGCGFRHSHQHGFGVLDAYRLTTAAQVHDTPTIALIHVQGNLHYQESIMRTNVHNKRFLALIDNILSPLITLIKGVYISISPPQVWPLLPDSLSWSSPIQNANMEIPPTEEWMVLNFTVNANDLPAGLVTLEHVAISVSL